MFYRIIICIGLCIIGISAQGQLIANYDFTDCFYNDGTGNQEDLTSTDFPACDCGLDTHGMNFDGINDHLTFPSALDSLMEEDFTLSFYMLLDNPTARMDILSVRNTCTLDSFMAVSFNPIDNTVSLEIAQTIGNIQTETAPLNIEACWHRVVITKSGLIYSIYLDDQLAISLLADGTVKFSKAARLAIGNSPCVGINQDRFRGQIDRVQMYNRALSAIELRANSLRPDQIINNDTTIVAGSEVMIDVGATCAENFSWSPVETLDDVNILNPIATPIETTQYLFTVAQNNGCTNTDSVTVYVINEDELDCTKILLPNAFTPNNDQLNDRFGISNLFIVDNLDYFEVYDRWGAKMWSTINKNEMWDGAFKGSPVNPGMYIYKVKYQCKGEEFVKVDNFSVIR